MKPLKGVKVISCSKGGNRAQVIYLNHTFHVERPLDAYEHERWMFCDSYLSAKVDQLQDHHALPKLKPFSHLLSTSISKQVDKLGGEA